METEKGDGVKILRKQRLVQLLDAREKGFRERGKIRSDLGFWVEQLEETMLFIRKKHMRL